MSIRAGKLDQCPEAEASGWQVNRRSRARRFQWLGRGVFFVALSLSGASQELSPASMQKSSLKQGAPAASQAAGRMENAQVHAIDFGGRAERELRENILPFWLRHAPASEHAGFHGAVGDDLKPNTKAPRGALLTSRILWTFSAAYRQFPDDAYLRMARRAYDDLLNNFRDPQEGGLYWTITAAGKPLDTSKQIYGQVFGIYALSEYYRATSDPAALAHAQTLYRLVEKHGRDAVNGGYFEAFTKDWRADRRVVSVVNRIADKSQNTHLHVMEAYTNLLRVWPDPELKQRQTELLEIMLTRIYEEKSGHLRLFVTAKWEPRSENVSYGHDIEAAWLMTEAAEVLGEPRLRERVRRAAVRIAEITLAEGIDRDHGVFYEGWPDGRRDARKEWWPQAEAVVGFLDAYQISGDARFKEAALASWRFIEERLVDRRGGEWFHSITQEGKPWRQPKISLWKCPYHNGRACLEVIARTSAAVK